VRRLDHDADVDEFIGFLEGMRLLKNFSINKTLVQPYNNVFDYLLQEFRDRAAGDTFELVVIHRIWDAMLPMQYILRESLSMNRSSHLPDI